MDSDHIFTRQRNYEHIFFFDTYPVPGNSTDLDSTYDELFEQLIDYPDDNPSPAFCIRECLECRNQYLSSDDERWFCDNCQFGSGSDEGSYWQQDLSPDGPTALLHNPQDYFYQHTEPATRESSSGEEFFATQTRELPAVPVPAPLVPAEPVPEQERPIPNVRRNAQARAAGAGRQFVFDRNGNEVRRRQRTRPRTPAEQAIITQKRGRVCPDCRRKKKRCVHVTVVGGPGPLHYTFRGLGGLLSSLVNSPLSPVSSAHSTLSRPLWSMRRSLLTQTGSRTETDTPDGLFQLIETSGSLVSEIFEAVKAILEGIPAFSRQAITASFLYLWEWPKFSTPQVCCILKSTEWVIDASRRMRLAPFCAEHPGVLKEVTAEQFKSLNFGTVFAANISSEIQPTSRLLRSSAVSHGRGSYWEVLRHRILPGPVGG